MKTYLNTKLENKKYILALYSVYKTKLLKNKVKYCHQVFFRFIMILCKSINYVMNLGQTS